MSDMLAPQPRKGLYKRQTSRQRMIQHITFMNSKKINGQQVEFYTKFHVGNKYISEGNIILLVPLNEAAYEF